MNTALWIAGYLITSLISYWIIFRGGAEWMEGSFVAEVLLFMHVPFWTTECIKFLFVALWIVNTIWFVMGCFSPGSRSFFMT